jgi:hypothetical protein
MSQVELGIEPLFWQETEKAAPMNGETPQVERQVRRMAAIVC